MIKDILAFLFGGSMGFLTIQLIMLHKYFLAGVAIVAYLFILVRCTV